MLNILLTKIFKEKFKNTSQLWIKIKQAFCTYNLKLKASKLLKIFKLIIPFNFGYNSISFLIKNSLDNNV